MSNIQRTPIYSDGNQIIGYRDPSQEPTTPAASSLEARVDALEAVPAPSVTSPLDYVVFKSDFTKGLYDTAAGSGVFQDAYGDVMASTDPNAKAIFPDEGKFLQTFGTTVLAAPAYDGIASLYRDDIGASAGMPRARSTSPPTTAQTSTSRWWATPASA